MASSDESDTMCRELPVEKGLKSRPLAASLSDLVAFGTLRYEVCNDLSEAE